MNKGENYIKIIKRKISLIILIFISFLLTLSSCTPISEEAKIESLVNGYANSISNQDWNKARSFCIEDSIFYTLIDDLEETINQAEESITIDYSIILSDITVNDNYATVTGIQSYILTDSEESQDNSGNISWDLQKVNGIWKLYQL